MNDVITRAMTEDYLREMKINRDTVDEESRTVELAFSSEEPYRRWYGNEILSHELSAVDLERFKDGRGNLLAFHNHSDVLGVIEKAWVDKDRVGRALVRFGKNARQSEFFDNVKDGIISNVSVGYSVQKMELVEQDEEKGDTYTVTRWQPMEISLVSCPADATVGVGRSKELQIKPKEVKEMGEPKKEDVTVDVIKIEKEAREKETSRVQNILLIGEDHGFQKEAAEAIKNNMDAGTFGKTVLDELSKRGLTPVDTTSDIGLTPKETRSFSIIKALHALANPTDRKAQDAAKFEFEASRAMGDLMRKEANGVFIPNEVLKRDLTVGTSTAGGHTVSTDLLAGSFIDLLRNKMMVNQLGATNISGLVGNVAIPKQSGGATSYWVAESGAPTESQQTFAQLTMTPNTVGAFTDISRKLLIQSSIDVEMFVQNDLATVLALALDVAAINGSGTSNQPTGILNTTGIGDVAGGTNGLAPAWSHIVDLWSDVAVANAAFGSLGYMTNAKVIGKLMQTAKVTSTDSRMIVEQFPDANGICNVAGSRCGVSNQVPSTLTKGTSSGVCSAIIFGNWADLIVATWSGVDINVDTSTGSTSGTVRVVALQDADIGVRHAESFSAMQDALTA